MKNSSYHFGPLLQSRLVLYLSIFLLYLSSIFFNPAPMHSKVSEGTPSHSLSDPPTHSQVLLIIYLSLFCFCFLCGIFLLLSNMQLEDPSFCLFSFVFAKRRIFFVLKKLLRKKLLVFMYPSIWSILVAVFYTYRRSYSLSGFYSWASTIRNIWATQIRA